MHVLRRLRLIRWRGRYFASALSVAISTSAALASYTIEVPASGSMPAYFSGTNARISATAIPPIAIATDSTPAMQPPLSPSNPLIVEAWLYIGGQLTYHYDWSSLPTPRPAPYPAMTVNVMFDSTHFADGTNLQVEFRVRDENGAIFSSSGYATVYNKATLYGRYDLEIQPLTWNGTEYVQGDSQNNTWASVYGVSDKLTDIGYSINAQRTSIGWTASQMLSDLEPCTLFLAHSHGNENNFWSDHNDYWYHYPNAYPYDQSHLSEAIWPLPALNRTNVVKPHREQANGTGLPPFNTGTPPINLAFLKYCHSGDANDFAEAFLYPGGNAYTGYSSFPEDQSLCGYAVSVDTTDSEPVASVFFDALYSGYTVHQSRIALYYSCGTDNANVYEGYLRVYGDFHTRLKGVYTGLSETNPVTAWWRKL